ncbi:DUF4124 domain-containing protein [Undibacterium oligocarboniphilum]|uniref:DUF4124 domain-containing protein n=1 Tax=Undibacterium oligocarboniphilum TaxID=666702 RepID=A0A850QE70_9BURK|nr:DUF4124 domain-containing protein [Undibacterium oligocarboniphilum]MBC3869207.1 DUF4124 domain-containing protein [Undibacterium oligocarboniphilum]NVO77187.1 DUF4124 domain-containing protein [Undibacterium oligocarboniphilum]
MPTTRRVINYWQLALLGCVATILWPFAVPAQTLYRCGNTYQDQPCGKGQQERVISVLHAPPENPAANIDASCRQRGEEAKKIIWMREVGATQERLLADGGSEERRKLIGDIYAQRGNSADVRAAVEKDCMEEKNRSRPPLKSSAGNNSATKPDTTGDTASASAAASANTRNSDATRIQGLCKQLREVLSHMQNGERSGGNAEEMDNMKTMRRDTEKEIKNLGCTNAR